MSSFGTSFEETLNTTINKDSSAIDIGSLGSIKYSNLDDNTNNNVNNHIKVVCRIRPENEFEYHHDRSTGIPFITPTSQTVTLNIKDCANQFTLDKVFDQNSSQLDVYNYVAAEIVDDFISGFNGCLLAYGQTGSGKSYTMLGRQNDIEMGLIPRISQDIFDRLNHSSSNMEYTVSVSFLEIHKEQIKDLINVNNGESSTQKFSIHEDKVRGIHIKDLANAFISTHEELYQILISGLQSRSTIATSMNSESSRSHAIFQIRLNQKHLNTGVTKSSQLFLVDLAGSEKVIKSNAVGQTLEEAKKINSSLSALGNVINALTDPKSTHVPYRDSKLTRILQEAIGGNSRTSLIINCSPSILNEQETLNSLRFGARAKTIKNSAHINTELSPSSLRLKINQLEQINQQNQSYIKELEAELNSWREGSTTTVYIPNNTNSTHTTPSKEFKSRLPQLTTSPNGNKHLHEELSRKDKKINELENEILNMKMDNLRASHNGESKLFSLQNSLHKISEKLNDVELVNINLKKHLLISEKIIESRDSKINQLKSTLDEQQRMIINEASGFKNKLQELRSVIDKHHMNEIIENKENSLQTSEDTIKLNTETNNFSDFKLKNDILSEIGSTIITPKRLSIISTQSPNRSERSSQSIDSPKSGLNLHIIKPVRGGLNI
ncbi:P-loop containing nucleoside triphosphate hydrolase protein [Scheffersomyces amazonensis]|uniref:P-loop containing nucleoside triphosphate hydrolase protein n=1 Tax=Scheffersomyces amazonensis TaxID=1078765 RepID=UPI00315CB032